MASSTETTLQLEAVSPAPSPLIIGSGETLNLDVMSPAAMAYLLEVLSVDINKIEELNRLRRSSGGKVGIVLGGKIADETASLGGKTIIDETPLLGGKSIDGTPLVGGKTLETPLLEGKAINETPLLGGKGIIETLLLEGKGVNEAPSADAIQKSETTIASKLTTTQTTTLPSIAMILTTSSPKLSDVTNQQELNNESPKRKSQRKRSLDEVDDGEEREESVDCGKSKKRSRSITTLSEENLSPSPQKQRSSSTSSNGYSESDTTSTTAIVQPTLKPNDNNNCTPPEDNAKKSRSRRFKEDELSFLDAVFKTDPYPDPMITERLSIQLDVPEHRIKVWFANRRHRQTRPSDPKPSIPSMDKTNLLTETAVLPAESSHASSAFPCTASLTSPYGMVPSGFDLSHHAPQKVTQLRTIPPRTPDLNAQQRTEAYIRSQIASTIQSRFPFSSPALIQLANQTMLSRSGLNPYHPFSYPLPGSIPAGQLPHAPVDVCDLARAPKRRPSNYSYYMEPPILPPLTADSTSYTDGISLSPAIDDSPSPWHWMP